VDQSKSRLVHSPFGKGCWAACWGDGHGMDGGVSRDECVVKGGERRRIKRSGSTPATHRLLLALLVAWGASLSFSPPPLRKFKSIVHRPGRWKALPGRATFPGRPAGQQCERPPPPFAKRPGLLLPPLPLMLPRAVEDNLFPWGRGAWVTAVMKAVPKRAVDRVCCRGTACGVDEARAFKVAWVFVW
jgi:hypothetical protein